MNQTPLNRIGVGLRSTHYPFLEQEPNLQIGWFEAISENYMDSHGRPREMLLHIRERYPVALHGVSLSPASPAGADPAYLNQLKKLVDQVDPFIVSDHLCWTRNDAHSLHDLLPFRYDKQASQIVCDNVNRAQDTLGRKILLENISAYLSFADNEVTECDFLEQIVAETGCGLLFDVNNLYVNATNYDFDARSYIDSYPLRHVGQIHIAGHTDTGKFLFDTHSAAVIDPVWQLLAYADQQLPGIPILLEWDEDIPEFTVLEAEALKARNYLNQHQDAA